MKKNQIKLKVKDVYKKFLEGQLIELAVAPKMNDSAVTPKVQITIVANRDIPLANFPSTESAINQIILGICMRLTLLNLSKNLMPSLRLQ